MEVKTSAARRQRGGFSSSGRYFVLMYRRCSELIANTTPVAFGSLGIAFAHLIPNVDSAPAYENAVFLPLIFISGVFYDADYAPGFLQAIAEVLPLKHLIDGLSGAIVTGAGLADNLPALAVLGLWSALGLTLAIRGFSWDARRA